MISPRQIDETIDCHFSNEVYAAATSAAAAASAATAVRW